MFPTDEPTTPTAPARSDAQLLRDSLKILEPRAGRLAPEFYARLFEHRPDVRPMFPADMTQQNEKLLGAILALVTHYEDTDKLRPALASMGRAHARFGIGLRDYADVGDVLIGVVASFSGPDWNPEYREAWIRAYHYAAGLMIAEAARVPTNPAHAITV